VFCHHKLPPRLLPCPSFSFFFFCSPSPLFTLHVNNGELLHCSLGRVAPDQPKMIWLGLAQLKKSKKSKILLKKI
jgi:hypothetical protein